MQELIKEKNRIRKECKKCRLEMTQAERQCADDIIFENIKSILDFCSIKTLYCYVSSPEIEVDTLKLIDIALEKKITVAVPKCVSGSYTLEHFIITSMDQLKKGTFGIMEPDPLICEKLLPPYEGICIVPGLAFDAAGVRMGYGKGYYDRFLENFRGMKIGLCYENCFYSESIPHDSFDAVMDIIVTDRKIRKIMSECE